MRGGINTYEYALNNPTRYIDPTGKIAVVDDAAALIIAGAAVTVAIICYATNCGQTVGDIINAIIPGDESGDNGAKAGAGTGNPDPCQVDPNLCGNSESSGLVPGKPGIPRGSVLYQILLKTGII